MQINDIFKNGITVSSISEIPLSDNGIYFIKYRNINKYDETKSGEMEYALYDISRGLGVVNGQFHFDVADTYVDVTYVKLEGICNV